MAHKVTNTEDAFALLQSKPQTIETLASAIVRGQGYSMTDSKVEFFKAYTETLESLEGRLFGALMMVIEPKRVEALKEALKETEAETEAEAEAETETEAEAEANA